MFLIFVKALAAGVALAAPIGPMALLCIRRTIANGWRAGLAVGAGIATGDMLLSLVPAIGLASISRLLLDHERLLHLAAGPVLAYLGARTLLDRSSAVERAEPFTSHANAYASSALLTLANPPTLIAFAALFTLIAPSSSDRLYSAAANVAGIAIGSLLWWIALISIVASARKALTSRTRRMISVLSGLALAGFGCFMVVDGVLRG